MLPHPVFRRGTCLALLGLLTWGSTPGEAGGLFRRRERPVGSVPAVRIAPAAISPAPLGTFVPNAYMTVRGNFPTGGGYSPLDSSGDTSMDIYGPTSALRTTSAPIQTYVRGYDGRSTLLEGTSFSTPNLPPNSPVIYPTRATNYYGFRESQDPPWWPKATNWIDQN